MTQDLVSILSGIGMDCSSFLGDFDSNYICLEAISEPSKYSLLVRWIIDIVSGVSFSGYVVSNSIENVMSEAEDSLEEGADLCTAVGMVLSRPSVMNLCTSAVSQLSVLSKAEGTMETSAAPIISILNEIRAYVFKSAPMAVQFIVPELFKDPVLPFAKQWAAVVKDSRKNPGTFPLSHRTETYPSVIPRGVILPISGVDSSFVRQYVSCSIPRNSDDAILCMLWCDILSCSEGPLYRKIRGMGLAYEGNLEYDTIRSTICYSLDNCSAVDRALAEFYSILESLPSQWPDLLSVEIAKTCRLSFFYSLQSTLPLLATTSLECIFDGYGSIENQTAHILSVFENTSEERLQQVFNQYFLQFLHPDARKTVVVTREEQIPSISTQLSAMQIPLSHFSPTSLSTFLNKLLPKQTPTCASAHTPKPKVKAKGRAKKRKE